MVHVHAICTTVATGAPQNPAQLCTVTLGAARSRWPRARAETRLVRPGCTPSGFSFSAVVSRVRWTDAPFAPEGVVQAAPIGVLLDDVQVPVLHARLQVEGREWHTDTRFWARLMPLMVPGHEARVGCWITGWPGLSHHHGTPINADHERMRLPPMQPYRQVKLCTCLTSCSYMPTAQFIRSFICQCLQVAHRSVTSTSVNPSY